MTLAQNTAMLAATLLEAAWRQRQPGEQLPRALRPSNLAEAYIIQAELVARLGPIGGWKSGAGSAEAIPAGSAIPSVAILTAPIGSSLALASTDFGQLGVEIEVCLRIDRDLPPRDTAYQQDDLLAVIGALLPAIELVDSRYQVWPNLPWPEQVADLQNCGRLILGQPLDDWRGFDFTAVRAIMTINGQVKADRVNGNTAGDILRTVLWLINHGPAKSRGLRAGDVVTTGSCNGLHMAAAGDLVCGAIDGLGSVSLQFD